MACGRIREFLRRQRFLGMQIEWFEGRGWFEREWIVRGDARHLEIIQRSILAWAEGQPGPAYHAP